MVITAFQNYVLSNGMQAAVDSFPLGFTAVIFVVALALLLYASQDAQAKLTALGRALRNKKKGLLMKALSRIWLPDPDSNQGPID